MKRYLIPYLALAAMFLFAPFTASAAEFEEGDAYQALSQPQPTSSGNKIEVIEFFWYGCPHCYQFDPLVERWKQTLGADVEFVQIPVMFRPEWEIHARAFYTAQMLKVSEKIHHAMFTAMHEMRRPLNNEAQIIALFKENGVSEADFKRTSTSFGVESKVRRTLDIHKRYGVNSVPTMVVNGKYQTSASLVHDNKTVLKVVDHLIDKERKARKK